MLEAVLLIIHVVVHQIVLVMYVVVVHVKVRWLNAFITQTVCFIVVPTCFDTVLNEDETTIDCGGVCLGVSSCATSYSCTASLDCISNVCTGNACQGKLAKCF